MKRTRLDHLVLNQGVPAAHPLPKAKKRRLLRQLRWLSPEQLVLPADLQAIIANTLPQAVGTFSIHFQPAYLLTAPYIPPRPPQGAMIDPQYPQGIALPTSATRLHQATWPPPWGTDGQGPSMGQMPPHLAYQVTGPHPIYYQPSPYYRQNTGMLPPHNQPLHHPQINRELIAQTQGMQNGIVSNEHAPATDHNGSRPGSASHGNVVDPRLSHTGAGPSERAVDCASSTSRGPDAQGELTQSYPNTPVIDPSLDVSAGGSAIGTSHTDNTGVNIGETDSEDISLKITQAAMEAVLESVRRETNLDVVSLGPGTPNSLNVKRTNGLQGNGFWSNDADTRRAPPLSEVDGEVDADGEADGEVEEELLITHELTADQGFHTPIHPSRPAPMEHILTEDGTPMLNPGQSHAAQHTTLSVSEFIVCPAELLTQVGHGSF